MGKKQEMLRGFESEIFIKTHGRWPVLGDKNTIHSLKDFIKRFRGSEACDYLIPYAEELLKNLRYYQ